jgi:hypothetical protein
LNVDRIDEYVDVGGQTGCTNSVESADRALDRQRTDARVLSDAGDHGVTERDCLGDIQV